MTEPCSEMALNDLLSPLLTSARASAGLPDFPLPEQLLANLTLYLNLLESWNERMDLVAPAPRDVLVERHLVDCLVAGELVFTHLGSTTGLLVLDVGSGAGLPGVVWGCRFPASRFVLCEPRDKRSLFLKEVKRKLGLENIEVLTARFEELSALKQRSAEQRYNLVTARALGMQEEFLRLCAELLAPAGQVALFVGSDFKEIPLPAGLAFTSHLPYSLTSDSSGRGIASWRAQSAAKCFT